MKNLKQQILARIKKKHIHAINIEGTIYNNYGVPEHEISDALERLDKDYDEGYGGTNAQSFWLWTEHFVYFMAEYDGSEWITTVPRHPIDGMPHHVGG